MRPYRSEEAEVLVVGGGPAGAATAAFLAGSGRTVLLLEKRPEGQGKVCGEFISAEAVPILKRLGLLEPLRKAGAIPIRSTRVRSIAGGTLDAFLPAAGENNGFSLSRLRFDSLLLSRAQSLGATVVQGAKLLSLTENRPEGRTALFSASGLSMTVRARLVIGADGRESRVARLSGLGGQFSDPRVGLQIHLRRETPPVDRVELLLLGKAYAGLVPVEEDRWTLGALCSLAGCRSGDPWEGIRHQCAVGEATAPALKGVGDVLSRQSTFPVRVGLRACTAPGLLLAGDAAGTVDPFCGQGIALALATGAAAAVSAQAILVGGDDKTERGRYAAFVHREVGSRLSVCVPLRFLVDRPRAAAWLLGRLQRDPEATSQLVRLTRSRESTSRLRLPFLLARLLKA